MHQHLWRISESVVAFILLIFTIVYWKRNEIGQNMINFEAVIIWAVGVDNIVIAYRWIINQPTFEYEASFLLVSFFIIGKLFEKFHPTQFTNAFNSFCQYNVLLPLYANLVFIILMLVVLVLYSCRQFYRLMTQTLLSMNANLQPEQLNKIMSLKKPYQSLQQDIPDASHTCSICLMQFQRDSSAILLPVCQHCFHEECIRQWLQTKSTCPYCRNNIRLSLL